MNDERIEQIMQAMIRIAGGELDTRLEPSPRDDALDAIAVGLNMLAEELAARDEHRAQLEAQTRHADRLSVLGQVAAGVAHDLNNPLHGVQAFASMIRERSGDARVRELADEVLRESARAHAIARDLLDLAKRNEEEPRRVEVEDLVGDLTRLIRTLLSADGIGLEVELAAGLGPLHCRPRQLRQVLLNLITNARHALCGEAARRRVSRVITVRGSSPSPARVQLSVLDSGAGVDSWVAERLFEPFVTTKTADRGVGLGLAISRRIVQEHGGTIHFESAPGRTEFFVDLPSGEGP